VLAAGISPVPANAGNMIAGPTPLVAATSTTLTNYPLFGKAGALFSITGVPGTSGTVQQGVLLDPNYGLPKIEEIADGTANSVILYEDVGRNEFMNGFDYTSGTTGATKANEYYDVRQSEVIGVTLKKAHWRFADPDTASGMKRKVNNTQGGSMTGPDSNLSAGDNSGCPGQSWTIHDCGPNNEAFSFHGGGAHMAFADGHVAFVRDTVSVQVLLSISTRNNSKNEQGLDFTE
jgi:prepilin-type processing-associated H-X9-DG protein